MPVSPRNSTYLFTPLLYANESQITEFQNTGIVPGNYNPFEFESHLHCSNHVPKVVTVGQLFIKTNHEPTKTLSIKVLMMHKKTPLQKDSHHTITFSGKLDKVNEKQAGNGPSRRPVQGTKFNRGTRL